MIKLYTNKSLNNGINELLKSSEIEFELKNYSDPINQSFINIFMYSDELSTAFEDKLTSSSLSNPLIIFADSNSDLNSLEKYPISKVYYSTPSSEQFTSDLIILLGSNRKRLQHYKNYFIGMLLESALHELNNPITSISLNCQLILELSESEDGIGNEQINSMVGSINKTVNTAATVSKNLVNFARQPDYEAELINGKDIINATYIFMKPIVRMKRHDLTVDDNDALIYANKSDFSLLFVIMIYLLVQFLNEKDLIEISFKENLMIYSFNKVLNKYEDIFLNQKLPVFDLRLIINEICQKNRFELIVVDGNIHIATTAEMIEE